MWRCIATGVISASLLVACAQKESCDLTKELDLTISVGKDLAFPIGSTGKIMLSDLIDPTDIDILEVDTVTGDYSLVKSGAISCASNFLSQSEHLYDTVITSLYEITLMLSTTLCACTPL